MLESVILENFRCFRGRHEVPLAPLTFLVGENSTGKTSFLAATRLVRQSFDWNRLLDLNEPPFELGSFEQALAQGAGTSFRLGCSLPAETTKRPAEVALGPRVSCEATFANGTPHHLSVTRWLVSSGEFSLLVEPHGSVDEAAGSVRRGSDLLAWARSHWAGGMGRALASRVRLSGVLRSMGDSMATTALAALVADALESALDEAASHPMWALAPVRARPKRTYDPLGEFESPSGDHVPAVLARLRRVRGEEWASLHGALKGFGADGGLFGDLDVKLLGRHESDPFQIRVRIGRHQVNLIDVGYGVSQVLPILLESHRLPPGGTLLLQQPEVHLHPRAQAALGTYFGYLCGAGERRLIVETHSDYLVDRVRWMVRKAPEGFVAAKDVLILWFECKGLDVTIHPIRLDDQGNLVGAPPAYGEFFLAEERNLLGV